MQRDALVRAGDEKSTGASRRGGRGREERRREAVRETSAFKVANFRSMEWRSLKYVFSRRRFYRVTYGDAVGRV